MAERQTLGAELPAAAIKPSRRGLLVLLGAAAAAGPTAWLAGCAATGSKEIDAARAVLAPTGTLRVAVYAGSPTSMVRVPGSEEMRGVSVDLGRALAARLGVPAEIVVFQRVAEVVEALKGGRADVTVTNATPARAREVDFAPPLISLELGYLVLAGSPVSTLDEVDRPGVRVGVSQGSTSQSTLGASLKQARVVGASSLAAARQMLQQREIDVFATNKAILHEMADALPAARILDGRWGAEHLAIAVPQGRQAAAGFLRAYTEEAQRDGLLRGAAERAGLRGWVVAR